ncbi:unnamed protein product [Spirodela intermedia]|uniref:RRM domain-containing protein n=1 Tax=Spirodela intermedia TaxID=51605 RepID=A0A7I8KS30_SPIIN|nr:unnamed protein product [Spirodela intermedia]
MRDGGEILQTAIRDFFLEISWRLARSVSPQASDRDYPPEIWTSRPCIVIQSLPQRVTEQEIRLLFEGYAITTVAFDANHSAWIRLHNKHRESIPSLERHLRRSVLGGRNLKELVSFCSDGPALFVGNMPEVVDDDALRSIFQRHGKIDRAFIARNADGRSKGFGFVEYTVVSDSWADEVEIMHLSDQNLFIERARWRVFSLHQAVSLGVYGLPIHSLRQARMTLLGLFGRYGITLGHYIDTQNSMAFVDFFTHDQADNAWRNLNGYQIEGKRLKVFFTSPGKRAVDRRLEHEEAKTLESIEHRKYLVASNSRIQEYHFLGFIFVLNLHMTSTPRAAAPRRQQ